jgi:predicted transcriptional regulator
MRAKWNETNRLVLETISAKPKLAAQQIAERVGKGVRSVSTILLRLHRQGCVSRTRIVDGEVTVDVEEGISRPRYVYVYESTEKGRHRLESGNVGKQSPPQLLSSV